MFSAVILPVILVIQHFVPSFVYLYCSGTGNNTVDVLFHGTVRLLASITC